MSAATGASVVERMHWSSTRYTHGEDFCTLVRARDYLIVAQFADESAEAFAVFLKCGTLLEHPVNQFGNLEDAIRRGSRYEDELGKFLGLRVDSALLHHPVNSLGHHTDTKRGRTVSGLKVEHSSQVTHQL